jgi:hypothetical protein
MGYAPGDYAGRGVSRAAACGYPSRSPVCLLSNKRDSDHKKSRRGIIPSRSVSEDLSASIIEIFR